MGNLARAATEEDLRAIFEPHGSVSSASVVKDKFTGDSRGFGFIEMPSKAEAQNAIQALNSALHMGRTITVNEARPREDRPRSGGFGGGGRRY